MPSASVVEFKRLGRETDGTPGTLGIVTGGLVGSAGSVGAGGVGVESGAGGVGGGGGSLGTGELVVGGAVGAAAAGSRVVPPPAGMLGVLAFGFLDTGVLRGACTGMRTVLWVRRGSGWVSWMLAVCLVWRRTAFVVVVAETASRWGCVAAGWRYVFRSIAVP